MCNIIHTCSICTDCQRNKMFRWRYPLEHFTNLESKLFGAAQWAEQAHPLADGQHEGEESWWWWRGWNEAILRNSYFVPNNDKTDHLVLIFSSSWYDLVAGRTSPWTAETRAQSAFGQGATTRSKPRLSILHSSPRNCELFIWIWLVCFGIILQINVT